MDSINHNIIIDNYKNNETVCYSLVLLKGTVITNYKSSCNKNSQNVLKIQNETQNFKLHFQNNKFKSLISLNLGENKLSVTYCCCKINYNINFKPNVTKYCVVPIYIVCKNHDGKFQAPETEDNSIQSACDRIYTGAKLIQMIIAEKFFENGFSRKTFQFESDLDPLAPKCRVFNSKLDVETVRTMKEDRWKYFGREIMESNLKNENFKYLAFISCTKYCGDKFGPNIKTHDDVTRITEGHVALGGGGLAIFGSACLYTWPKNIESVSQCFLNESLVDKTRFMDDSCYRGTLSGCFATTLGSVCHELCHTFDLGHTTDGVMGRGFDNIDQEFVFKNLKKTKIIKKQDTDTNKDTVIKVTQNIVPNEERIKYKPPVFQNDAKIWNKNGIFWTPNCTVLLYYHRWFNSEITSTNNILEFQNDSKIIYSSSGIRIVEIRDNILGMLIKWWDFSKKPENSFEIAELKQFNCSSFILIVEDSAGNILKEVFENIM